MSASPYPRARPVRLPRRLRRDPRRGCRARRSDRHRRQRQHRILQARRLPQAMAGAHDQRRHRRAEHGRRRLGPRQWRQDPLCQRRLVLPHRPRARADQGRRRLHQRERKARRAVAWRRLWRTWADPSFDRGYGLAEAFAQSRDRRAVPTLGRPPRPWRPPRRTKVQCSYASPGSAFPSCRVPTTRGSKSARPRLCGKETDVAIIAYGVMVTRALEAADRLAEGGVSARVVNMASIAPLDEAAIRAAADLGAIVTVEEHSQRGGLGGAVAEVVAGYRPCPVRILGFPGFMPTGSPKFLFERFGLDVGRRREGRTGSDCAPVVVNERLRPRHRPRHDQHQGVGPRPGRHGSSPATRSPTPIAYPRPGWVEQSGDEIWRATTAAIEGCLSSLPAGATIAAIGVSNQRETVLLWRRSTGETVGPCVTWQCRRSSDRIDASPHAGDRARSRSQDGARPRSAVSRRQDRLASGRLSRGPFPRGSKRSLRRNHRFLASVQPDRGRGPRDRCGQRFPYATVRHSSARLERRALRPVRGAEVDPASR